MKSVKKSGANSILDLTPSKWRLSPALMSWSPLYQTRRWPLTTTRSC